jgi:D-alanyl-D-alanine dipeptidase
MLRTVLRHAMEQPAFTVYETKWWHFDFYDWQSYPILNQTFEPLTKTDHLNKTPSRTLRPH